MPGGLLFLCLHQRCGGQHAGDSSLNIAPPKAAHDARAFFWGAWHHLVPLARETRQPALPAFAAWGGFQRTSIQPDPRMSSDAAQQQVLASFCRHLLPPRPRGWGGGEGNMIASMSSRQDHS